ncbi:MAG: ribosome recycling factor [Candidatus Paceibacterota bacterium]
MATDINTLKKQLASATEWLRKEFQQIRTGQASPSVLDNVRVEIYGAPMSLKEVASVTLEGARTLRIAPWDKTHIKEIEKAISTSNLGLSVAVDDQGLRVNFPQLTTESRQEIVKAAKDKLEEARKQVRREREDYIKDLQAKEKDGGMGKDEVFRLKGDVQKIVDEENKKLEELFAKKEKEILS